MLSTAQVGPQPVDLAARFMLDGSRITIENLGGEAIRFAPAEAAGEAAPADLRGGFLLEPGERETFQPAGGATFPLWAWGGGEVGVGPAIGPEAGGGGRTLGPQTNTFGDGTTANRAAAEALRDAYAAANADWLAQYNRNRSFLILLRWTGDGEVVQRRNVAGDDWGDVTDVIKGAAGDKGDKGDTGAGVPDGGAAGSVLAKQTAADQDTHWLDLSAIYRTAAQVTAAINAALADYSTTAQVTAAINAAVAGLRDGVGSAFDTLNELAAAVQARTTLAAALMAVRAGAGISIDRSVNGQITIAADAGSAVFDIACGWSDDDSAEVAELTADSDTDTVVIPDRATNGYLLLWTAADHGDPSEVYFGASPVNELSTFGAAAALQRAGVAGFVRVTVNQRVGSLLSGENLRVVF